MQNAKTYVLINQKPTCSYQLFDLNDLSFAHLSNRLCFELLARHFDIL